MNLQVTLSNIKMKLIPELKKNVITIVRLAYKAFNIWSNVVIYHISIYCITFVQSDKKALKKNSIILRFLNQNYR